MKIKVRANEVPEDVDYLTAGKVYEAEFLSVHPLGRSIYAIESDGGETTNIVINDTCAHLNGGKWEIVEEMTDE